MFSSSSTVLIVLLALALLSSCNKPAPDVASDRASGPHIEFWVTPLDATPDHLRDRTNAWSQNDSVDSVAVVIVGLDGTVVPSVALELRAEEQLEGDATPTGRVRPKIIPWRTLTNVSVDSLSHSSAGRLLVAIRPSELWRRIKETLGDVYYVRSLNVRLQLADGREVAQSLDLLWD
jgi:hypothetical protein